MTTTSDGKKDFWDKLQVSTVSIAALAVPVALGLLGNAFNAATKEKEVRIKTVEIAIDVLAKDPDKSTPFLRDWAIDVVDSYSGIPLSAKARDELRRIALPSRDAERVLRSMSSAIHGTNGGLFFESSVPNAKVFVNDSEITKFVPYANPVTAMIAPIGTVKVRVEFDGGKFETLVPVELNRLTKIVVAPTGVSAERPVLIESILK
jgi:hypothetical protein